MENYTEEFYRTYTADSQGSAKEVIPLILELFNPQSVVDVGCGIGTWLSVVEQLGVKTFLGIDGDYVNQSQLLFSQDNFYAHDLRTPLFLPPDFKQYFDIAISLEVAEDLPPPSAIQFVSTLTSLAPVVLFSAAIPFQGGTDHLNEQWPNYWAAKGYRTLDWLRPRVWANEKVSYYYAQNSLLFIQNSLLNTYPSLREYATSADNPVLSKVHPRKWVEANNSRSQPLKRVLAALPYSLKNAFTRRFKF